jgi:hypothetical protein
VSRRHAAGVADLRAEVRWSRDHEDSGDRNETRSDSSSA